MQRLFSRVSSTFRIFGKRFMVSWLESCRFGVTCNLTEVLLAKMVGVFVLKPAEVVDYRHNPAFGRAAVFLTAQSTTYHLHVSNRAEYLRAMNTISILGASKPVDRTLWLQSARISPRWNRSRK